MNRHLDYFERAGLARRFADRWAAVIWSLGLTHGR